MGRRVRFDDGLDIFLNRRFLPLFVTQSLGAFNDNLFKNAIVFMVTFSMAQQEGINAPLMVAAAAGVFIFPFFIFSASAGQIADKYDKARLGSASSSWPRLGSCWSQAWALRWAMSGFATIMMAG